MKIRPALVLLTASMGAGGGARYWMAGVKPEAVSPSGNPQKDAAGVQKNSTVPAARPRPPEADVMSEQSTGHFRLLMDWLANATPEELARMATASVALPETLSVRLVMARWAEVDPAGMLGWVATQNGNSPRNGREFLENNAWEAWARVDFDAAWKTAGNDKFRISILMGLTASDPGRALDILRSQPELLQLKGWSQMGKVLGRIARQFPAEAAQLAAQHLPGNWATGTVYSAWSLTDPVQALAQARLEGRNLVESTLTALQQNMGRDGQAEVTAEMVNALPGGPAKMRLEAILLSQLARRDPAAAITALGAMQEGNPRQFSAVTLLAEFSQQGRLTEAAAMAAQLGWSFNRQWLPGYVTTSGPSANISNFSDSYPYMEAFKDVARQLAASDPGAGLGIIRKGADSEIVSELLPLLKGRPAELVDALHSQNGSRDMASGVLSEWLQKDAPAAAAWMAGNDDHHAYAQNFCTQWAGSNPDALRQWAKNTPYAAEAWTAIVGTGRPDIGVAHLSDMAAEAPEAALQLQSALEQQDPSAGIKLVKLLPDTARLLPATMHTWMEQEPEQAAQWAESLPAGEKRATATASIADWYSAQGEFGAASRWAAAVPGAAGDAALTQTFAKWIASDAAAARTALDGLPAARQKALRALFPP